MKLVAWLCSISCDADKDDLNIDKLQPCEAGKRDNGNASLVIT